MSEEQNRIAELNAQANKYIQAWAEKLDAASFAEAAQVAITCLESHFASACAPSDTELLSRHLSIRVFLNGLRDFANLKLVLSREDWIEHPKAVEEAWRLAHDAKDRLTGGHSRLSPASIAHFKAELDQFFDQIRERFGPGVYCSWEMTCKEMTCSICGMDVRGCDHLSGRWYDGKLCEYHVTSGEVTSVSMVGYPKDPRCRVWPWKLTEDTDGQVIFSHVPIYIMFRLEGDDNHGRVIDLALLFDTP